MYYCYVDTAVGRLQLTGNEKLEGLHFPKGKTRVEPEEDWIEAPEKFAEVIQQLKAYFEGRQKRFHLDLDPKGTDFQKKVWQQLLKIPYGQTISYGELAKRVGNPKASRAVGLANGKNPISIIIPCHRVIGKNGNLTGFGGGIDVKRFLLDLEQGSLF